MRNLIVLKHALANVKEFSETDIIEDNFKKTIGQLKATMHKLKARITNEEQLTQIEDIIKFKIISQKHPIEQFLIRYIVSNKYGSLALGRTRKANTYMILINLNSSLAG